MAIGQVALRYLAVGDSPPILTRCLMSATPLKSAWTEDSHFSARFEELEQKSGGLVVASGRLTLFVAGVGCGLSWRRLSGIAMVRAFR